MSKLDDLCAIKMMGYYWAGPDVIIGSRNTYFPGPDLRTNPIKFSPSTSLDDALVCLERAAKGQRFEIVYVSDIMKLSGDRGWYARINAGIASFETTAALAMCLCSLRAMGVPESEISLAMEN